MKIIMRGIFVLFTISLITIVHCLPTSEVNVNVKPYKIADEVFLERQRNILRLFKYIFQHNYYKDQVDVAQTFDIKQEFANFDQQKYVKEFLNYYEDEALPRGEIFSIFHETHRKYATALCYVLYNAKDWDTFYKTACWAREFVNEGIFVYAIHFAVLHRTDTQGMVLPPIYEIYPYYFAHSDVVDKAYEYKMKYGNADEKNKFLILSNYTKWYENVNPENRALSYFTEDIGLNAYYYYYNMDYPFWWGGENCTLINDRRGELYYFVHQQLLARYYMERLSNGYGSIHALDWNKSIKTDYVPAMRYSNGLEFPNRPTDVNYINNPYKEAFNDNDFLIERIEDYESRIRDAIDLGYVFSENGQKIDLYSKDGFDLLGRLVEGNPDSPNNRFYGYLQVIAHQVLGNVYYSNDKVNVHPSTLEHFETALHDPVFYQLYKRIISYFIQYKNQLPPYNYDQLNYSEVKITNIYVDKLITYFDKFDWEVTNALYVNEQEFEQENLRIWTRQHRLNHKPFTYKIFAQSDKPQNVVVRVFLGPKFDETGREIPFNENRVNFIELEKFVYALQAGDNIIIRNSQQGEYVRDRSSYRALFHQVTAALEGKQEFHLDMSEAHNGFPNRYMLPKGKIGGQVYQFYVYISPSQDTIKQNNYDDVISAGVGSGHRYVDNLPFGYPLDRPIPDEANFYVPNSFVEDVVIFHKADLTNLY